MGALRRNTLVKAACVGGALGLLLAACDAGDEIEQGAVEPTEEVAPAAGDVAEPVEEEPAQQ